MKKIIFLGILVFIVSVGVGFLYTTLFYNPQSMKNKDINADEVDGAIFQNYTKLQTLEASSQEEEKISPKANFAIKQYYDECEHFTFKYEKLPPELVNMTRQEVEDYYDDYEVEEFSSNNVVLTKEINGLCDEHFFITLGDKHVEVNKLNSDGSFTQYLETDISKDYLPKEDIEKLKMGIYVYGSGKINSVLEDYE